MRDAATVVAGSTRGDGRVGAERCEPWEELEEASKSGKTACKAAIGSRGSG